MSSKLACFYPAFTLKYTGKEVSILELNGISLSHKLKEASDIVGEDLTDFDITQNSFLEDELKNQYLSYIFSCSFSDILREKEMEAHYTAGFSMGIYAALYGAGSMDFMSGLLVIKEVFMAIKEIIGNRDFSMASVIGFTRADIDAYLENYPSLECVIQNGEHSYVLSGPTADMKPAMEFFREEGAIHLGRFSVSCPYHSSVLSPHRHVFDQLMQGLELADPHTPITSCIDQRWMKGSEDLRDELVNNVITPLNFYRSVLSLQEHGIHTFMEVGPGDALTKSSKFIEGEFQFRALAKGKVI